MPFEKDLFISYAHVDDQTASKEDEGWITLFHQYLDTFLTQNLGKKARIWRDDRLRGLDVFEREIVSQFPKTALLVSILTPRYLKSAWCTREVDEFLKAAEKTGGLMVEDKSRAIKVVQLPVPVEEQPSVMQKILGYEFFIRDGPHDVPLNPIFGKEFAEAYRRKIYILAQDIARLLELMARLLDAGGEAGPGPDSVNGRARPAVYLAECSYDRREDRERLRGELQAHGYAILPDRRLPDLEADYVAEVDRLLDQCRFAVHLVGGAYGSVPDGPTLKSNVMLQNEIAAAKSRHGGLQRVIWLPEGTRSEQAQQQAFIEALHREADLQRGADLITGDLETLKAAIHATLRKIENAAQEPGAQPEAGVRRLVYLICDRMDRTATIPVLKYLRGEGFEVKLPVFSGDATAVREANEALMSTCDAVLLFWGAGDEAWKSHHENDLRKNLGLRERPLRAACTYLAEPKTDEKAFAILAEEPDVIDGQAGFSEAAMAAFVERLRA